MISIGQKRDDDLGSTVEHQPVGKLVQQSLGETVHLDSSKLTQSPKTNRDSTGRPVAQEVVVGVLQEEPSSSDRPGRPVSREEQHVQTHDSSGRPESEEAQHIVQANDNREHRETVDQFDLATNDANIDFSVSGIPEETVKRSATMNILELIRRITRHPQKQAVQNDLDKKSRRRRSKNQATSRFPRSSTRSRSCSASFASIIAIQESYTVYVDV